MCVSSNKYKHYTHLPKIPINAAYKLNYKNKRLTAIGAQLISA